MDFKVTLCEIYLNLPTTVLFNLKLHFYNIEIKKSQQISELILYIIYDL